MKLAGAAQAELIKWGLLAAAVIGAGWYLKHKAQGLVPSVGDAVDTVLAVPGRVLAAVVDTAGAAAQAVNPVSDQNIFYRSANANVQMLTGRKDATLGTWLYDITHPGE